MIADPFDAIQPEPAATPNGHAEADPPRVGARDRLIVIGAAANLWRSTDGEAFVSFESGGHTEHHNVNSRAFRDWLKTIYAARWPTFIEGQRHPGSPSRKALDEAVDALETRARIEGETHDAALRSVMVGGRIYIDMGDPAWRAIEVTPRGWRVVERSPVPILRSRKAKPLPVPTSPGDVRLLGELFALTEEDLRLTVSWMLAALWPIGPFPILSVSGEQNSGKSTFTRAARRLVDPAGGDIIGAPRDERDLIATARHNKVMAYDNLSAVPAELADMICRLSTGSELGGRALFTNDDSASFEASRPIIMNSIIDLAERGDLASRATHITLPVLATSSDDSSFWARFEEFAPTIFAGLLDGMCRALRDLAATPTPQGIRMSGFARLAAAAAPAWGWSGDQIAEHMRENQRNQIATLIDADPVAVAVVAFMEQTGGFNGKVGDLLTRLGFVAGEAISRAASWPRTPHQLSSRLTRAAPALRASGIHVERTRSMAERWIRLSRRPSQP